VGTCTYTGSMHITIICVQDKVLQLDNYFVSNMAEGKVANKNTEEATATSLQ